MPALMQAGIPACAAETSPRTSTQRSPTKSKTCNIPHKRAWMPPKQCLILPSVFCETKKIPSRLELGLLLVFLQAFGGADPGAAAPERHRNGCSHTLPTFRISNCARTSNTKFTTLPLRFPVGLPAEPSELAEKATAPLGLPANACSKAPRPRSVVRSGACGIQHYRAPVTGTLEFACGKSIPSQSYKDNSTQSCVPFQATADALSIAQSVGPA